MNGQRPGCFRPIPHASASRPARIYRWCRVDLRRDRCDGEPDPPTLQGVYIRPLIYAVTIRSGSIRFPAHDVLMLGEWPAYLRRKDRKESRKSHLGQEPRHDAGDGESVANPNAQLITWRRAAATVGTPASRAT